MRRVSALTYAGNKAHVNCHDGVGEKRSSIVPWEYGCPSSPTPQWRQHTPTACIGGGEPFFGSFARGMLSRYPLAHSDTCALANAGTMTSW